MVCEDAGMGRSFCESAARIGVHVVLVQKVTGSVSKMGVWLKLGR